jgi:hypothetical protein
MDLVFKVIFMVDEMKNCVNEQGLNKTPFHSYNPIIESCEGNDGITLEQL